MILQLRSHSAYFKQIGKIPAALFLANFLLFCGHGVLAQSKENLALKNSSLIGKGSSLNKNEKSAAESESGLAAQDTAGFNSNEINDPKTLEEETPKKAVPKKDKSLTKQFFEPVGIDVSPNSNARRVAAITPFTEDEDDSAKDDAAKIPPGEFQWRPAMQQMFLFLAVQHSYALTQPKTRQALKGRFLKDYIKSVKSLHGWGDGGRFFTNYVAHPMQGAFTGFIQVHNDPKGKRQRFGASADYWNSRMKALAWTAAWSTQFEIGPLSQASIGNVGLSGKQTWVDLVVTPTLGTAMLISEDAVDRFLIERMERNYYVMIVSRTLLNPTRTVANLIRFKLPWYRDRGRVR